MKGSFSALIAPQRLLDARLRGHDSGEIMVFRRYRMAKVCDCFPQLKEITDARERRYRADPEKAAPEGPQSFVEVKLTSIGGLNELVECKRSGFKFVISEPSHVGGQNCAPSPLEFLLSGAVGCYAAVFAFYAAKLGIAYDGFEAVARTEFDARGHMIADAPPSAFRKVTISLRVKSDAPEDKLREVERLAFAGCPGINTLRAPVPVETRLEVTNTKAEQAA
jgi:uncharacterized OsmC-like protein